MTTATKIGAVGLTDLGWMAETIRPFGSKATRVVTAVGSVDFTETLSGRRAMRNAQFQLRANDTHRAVPASAAPAPAAASPLLSRRETFPGCWVERWQKGPDASRRVRALRAKLSSVQTRSGTVNQRWTSELGADRTTVETLEITYHAAGAILASLPAPLT